MPDSAINNTQGLSETGIGTRQFRSGTSRMLSTAVSRGNFEVGMEEDDKVKRFYNLVYKMVSTWAHDDKLAILSEYGEMSTIKNINDDKEINKATATTLIIHLDRNDIQQLISDVKLSKQELVKDVKTINNKHKRLSSFFNIKTFEESYKHVIDAQNSKDFIDKFRNMDSVYMIPKYLLGQYKALRHELYDVLKQCFNKVEINIMAVNMGIKIGDRDQFDKIAKRIINKTLLYVDLIVGKSPDNYGNGIIDPTPYEELLSYTSFAFVTGKPGMDSKEWAEKKRAARIAKRAVQERLKQRMKKASTKSKWFKDVAGIGGSKLAMLNAIKSGQDTGILANASLEEVTDLAEKYGIIVTKKSNIGKIKLQIYRAMANDTRRTAQLTKRLNKSTSKGKFDREAQDLLSLYKDKGSISGQGMSYSDGTPVVHFNKSGEILSGSINSAVPVYLVGQGGAGMQLLKGSPLTKNMGFGTGFSHNDGIISTGDNAGSKLKIPTPEELSVVSKLESMNYEELHKFITKYENKIAKKALDAANEFYGRYINEKDLTNKPLARAYAYIWAVVTNHKTLADYLAETYKIVLPNPKSKWVAIKTVGKAIKGLGFGLLKVKEAIEHPIKTLKKIGEVLTSKLRGKHFEDLTEKSQILFRSMYNIGFDGAVEISRKLVDNGFSNKLMPVTADLATRKVSEFTDDAAVKNLDSSESIGIDKRQRLFKLILIRNYSIIKGYNDIKNYAENEISKIVKLNDVIFESSKLHDFYKKERMLRGIGQGVGGFFKSVATLFRKKSKLQLGETLAEKPEEDANPKENPGQRLPIPKVSFNGGNVDTASILEVVPVFVVNKLTNKSGEPEEFEKGIGKNTVKANTYSILKNNESTLGDNKVKLTKDADVILKEMQEQGYTPVSKVLNAGPNEDGEPQPGKGKAGKMYALKTEDLEWALDNDYKFAQGGHAFIAGDSVNGRENPELVSINGNGSFSVRPLKAGPANNYSPLSMDSKYAEGGFGSAVKEGAQNIFNKIFGLNKNNTAEKKEQEKRVQLSEALLAMNILASIDVEPEAGITTMKRKRLASYIRRQLADVLKEGGSRIKLTSFSHIDDTTGYEFKVKGKKATPVYVVNSQSTGKTAEWLDANLASILAQGFGTEVVAAPMGTGAITRPGLMISGVTSKIKDIAEDAIYSAKVTADAMAAATQNASTFSTGARITRMPTGGTVAITGDASGTNIFKNGARPELVQSNGDMKVTPLNTAGTAARQKVSRMTSSERREALATSISSHVVKFNRTLPEGVSEVSNAGEAIKVYSINPGITDKVDINGSSVSLIELLAAMTAQLTALSGSAQTRNELLTAVVANTSKITASTKGSGGQNPFAGGFPSTLDGILEGS